MNNLAKVLNQSGYACIECERHQSDHRNTGRIYCKYFHMMFDEQHFCKEFRDAKVEAKSAKTYQG